MNIKEQIEQLKEARTQEIINDKLISKIDKLKLLETEKLFEYAPYIQHEFVEWEKEAQEQDKAISKKDWSTTDSFLSPSVSAYEKYEIISYAEALEVFFEDCEDEFEGGNDGPFDGEKYVVITCRSSDVVIQKTKQEIIDAIYEYCIMNKIIGFINTW